MVTKTFKSFADLTPPPNTNKQSQKELTPAKQAEQARKKQMQQNVPGILSKKGVKFVSESNGAKLVVTHVDTLVDYWPGAGRWQERKVNPHGDWGIQSLFEYLGVET
jgi:hypothetical protein